MIKRILLLLLPAALLASCRPSNVEISGEIKNAAKTRVYLERLDVDQSVPVDSATTDRSGKFSFRTQVADPVFYSVRIEKDAPVTIVAEADRKIVITGERTELDKNYWINGSDASLLIKLLNFQLNKTRTAMDSLKKIYAALPGTKESEKERSRISAEWDSVVSKQIRSSKEFIIKNAVSPAAYYALYQKLDKDLFILNPVNEFYSYKVVLSSMLAMYPESPYTKALKGHYEQIQKSIQTGKIQQLIQHSESTLPSIKLADRNGKEQTLESLKGKYILVDFTLLTAKDNQAHTNNLKQLYAKYRSKGFEIFQVCLDPNRLLWEEVHKKSGINWICLQDPDGADSRAARNWNVREIPANYLINRQYEIVGKDLYGQRLCDRLADIIK